MITDILTAIDDIMYYPILIIIMAVADITMGLMTMINLPCCFILFGTARKALSDYEKQKKAGKDPAFRAKDIGMDADKLSFWQ